MSKVVKFTLSKKPTKGGVVMYKNVPVREKILTRLFGEKRQIMIIVAKKPCSVILDLGEHQTAMVQGEGK